MAIEELEECTFRALGVGAFETVARILEFQQLHFDFSRFQSIVDPGGLFEGDVRILGAVQEQGRGRIGSDPIQWAGQNVPPSRVLHVTSEK